MTKSGNIISDLPKYFYSYHKRIGWRLYLLLGLITFCALLELGALATFVPILTGEKGTEKYESFLKHFSSSETPNESVELATRLIVTGAIVVIWRLFELGSTAWRLQIMSQLLKQMRLRFLNQVNSLRYKSYLSEKSGDLANIMNAQVPSVAGALGPFFEGLKSGVLVTVFFIAAFVVEWKIAVAWILLGVIAAPLAAPTNRLRQALSARIARRQGRIQDLFIQLLRNFKYLKATSTDRVVNEQISDEIEMVRAESFRNDFGVASLHFTVHSIASLSVLLAFYVMSAPLGHDRASILILAAIIYRGSAGLAQVHQKWTQFCSVSGSITVVEEAEARLDENFEPETPGKKPVFSNDIALSNLSLNYGEKNVLSDVTIEIGKNETIGIAGESGAGKSTLLNLIIGLISPSKGKVTMDGVPYSTLTTSDLRNLFGYVTQEPMLFNDTISNNISLWSDQVSRERIHEVSKVTGAHEIATRSENGFDTIIGEQGMQISGGERQKIALAREICREKQILILDEATSSLDSNSENEINQCIEDCQGSVTIIVVAHRLASLKKCDRIYVINKGKVAESGSWKELVKKKAGMFRKMCVSQGLIPQEEKETV